MTTKLLLAAMLLTIVLLVSFALLNLAAIPELGVDPTAKNSQPENEVPKYRRLVSKRERLLRSLESLPTSPSSESPTIDQSFTAQRLRDIIFCLGLSADYLSVHFPNHKPQPSSYFHMTEPRARAARHKGQLNFEPEIRDMLFAFGDDKYPLDETVRILDEITTDFVIETSHIASKAAEYSGRTKLKIDDFKFAIRGDEILTGRVRELLAIDKELKESRKQFDTGEGRVGLERGGRRKKEDKVEEKEEVKAENSKPTQDEGLGEEDDE